MRYSRFLTLVSFLLLSHETLAWKNTGSFNLSSGVGVFELLGPARSSMSPHIGIDRTMIEGSTSLQVGPHFSLEIFTSFKQKQLSFLFSGEINHTSSLYSNQDLFSASHTRYYLDLGASYLFPLSNSLDMNLESTLGFSSNTFMNLHLMNQVFRLGLKGKLGIRWKIAEFYSELFVPFWSEYQQKIFKDTFIQSFMKNRGFALKSQLSFKLKKRFNLFFESYVENFELDGIPSASSNSSIILLKPLASPEKTIVLYAYHFSSGVKIRF